MLYLGLFCTDCSYLPFYLLNINGINSSQVQRRIDQMAVACLDTTSLGDEAFNIEAAQDRCILRLIASCCNGEMLHIRNVPSLMYFVYILQSKR